MRIHHEIINDGSAPFADSPSGVLAYQNTLSAFRYAAKLQPVGGQGSHSVVVDYDVLVRAPRPDDTNPHRLYRPEDVDLRLAPGSSAISAGMVLPTINDTRRPCAYELAAPILAYGPRQWPDGMTKKHKV